MDTNIKAEMQNQLRHIVILKFKQSTTVAQIAQVEQEFSALRSMISQVSDLEWGTNVSPENLAKGFTHCFLITFKDGTARDEYLVHPEHKKFVDLLLPFVEDVFVIDFLRN
jgi:hypothetical protein